MEQRKRDEYLEQLQGVNNSMNNQQNTICTGFLAFRASYDVVAQTAASGDIEQGTCIVQSSHDWGLWCVRFNRTLNMILLFPTDDSASDTAEVLHEWHTFKGKSYILTMQINAFSSKYTQILK